MLLFNLLTISYRNYERIKCWLNFYLLFVLLLQILLLTLIRFKNDVHHSFCMPNLYLPIGILCVFLLSYWSINSFYFIVIRFIHSLNRNLALYQFKFDESIRTVVLKIHWKCFVFFFLYFKWCDEGQDFVKLLTKILNLFAYEFLVLLILHKTTKPNEKTVLSVPYHLSLPQIACKMLNTKMVMVWAAHYWHLNIEEAGPTKRLIKLSMK